MEICQAIEIFKKYNLASFDEIELKEAIKTILSFLSSLQSAEMPQPTYCIDKDYCGACKDLSKLNEKWLAYHLKKMGEKDKLLVRYIEEAQRLKGEFLLCSCSNPQRFGAHYIQGPNNVEGYTLNTCMNCHKEIKPQIKKMSERMNVDIFLLILQNVLQHGYFANEAEGKVAIKGIIDRKDLAQAIVREIERGER